MHARSTAEPASQRNASLRSAVASETPEDELHCSDAYGIRDKGLPRSTGRREAEQLRLRLLRKLQRLP